MFHFIRNYKRYGTEATTHDLVKFIALSIMIVDHMGNYFYPDQEMWRAIGRICVPMWFFLVGYAKPSTFDKEVVLFALWLVLVDIVFRQSVLPLNILFTIIATRYFLQYVERHSFREYQSWVYLPILGVAFFLTIFLVEYGTQATLFALFGYLVRYHRALKDTKIVAYAGVITYMLTQNLFYDFSGLQNLVMFLGVSGVMILLYHFSVQTIPIRPKILGMIVCLFARNTLYCYVLHLTLFIVIAYYQHPEKYQFLKLLG